ncbi:MAG: single-stranded DNA-binding protein [Patescibacteria group bacterium]
MNLNKVFILGNLTRDPELRQTTTGQPVSSFGIATNSFYTDKSGQKQQKAEFHNIVVWGRQAEIASQYLKKGGLAMVEGRLQTREWQDKQGQTRRTTEIIADHIQFGPKSSGGSGGQFGGEQRPSAPSQPKAEDSREEELPEINIDESDIKPEEIPF